MILIIKIIGPDDPGNAGIDAAMFISNELHNWKRSWLL